MRTTLPLALASILSLGIVGATPAAAGDGTATAPLRVFGKSMCLPSTPATARCDVRLAPPTPGVVRVFGQTWCLGAPAGTRCDLTLSTPPPAATTATAPRATPTPPADGVFSRWLRAVRERAAGERG